MDKRTRNALDAAIMAGLAEATCQNATGADAATIIRHFIRKADLRVTALAPDDGIPECLQGIR